MEFKANKWCIAVALLVLFGHFHVNAQAAPLIAAGDTSLRYDLQLLADHGILPGPVSTWPLAWGPVLEALEKRRANESLPPGVAVAMARIRARADWETRTRELTFSARLGGAAEPPVIRGFEDTPRENLEAGGGIRWIGDRVAIALNAQVVDRVAGGTDSRADGSALGIALGNWSLSLNTLDRWWGPGHDGSLILSGNARPFPAISLDRNFTDAFDSDWLSWMGPWDLSVMFGQLESDRVVPDALWFGMRFNFRPLNSLEIGLSRAAQWCGEGRPCNAGVFADLLLGRDNRGEAGIDADAEPGNQMAGLDFRWSHTSLGWPTALYGQFIGEDEAGGFPSRYIGQIGVEMNGRWGAETSWRGFVEFAGTACQFHESSVIFDCAYNHTVYRSGYRYRGRSIGHGADNDAELVSAGLVLLNDDDSQWRVLARAGELNRGGSSAAGNAVTRVAQDIMSVDISHRRVYRIGLVEAGIGYENRESTTGDDGDFRFHVQWRSGY